MDTLDVELVALVFQQIERTMWPVVPFVCRKWLQASRIVRRSDYGECHHSLSRDVDDDYEFEPDSDSESSNSSADSDPESELEPEPESESDIESTSESDNDTTAEARRRERAWGVRCRHTHTKCTARFVMRLIGRRWLTLLQWAVTHQRIALPDQATAWAAQAGDVAVLAWLHGRGCPIERDAYEDAATHGRICVIRWLQRHTPHRPPTSAMMRAAVEVGRLDMCRWLWSRYGPAGPWKGDLCAVAASLGHLAMLQWLHRRGFQLDRFVAPHAARSGRLDVLQWVCKQECRRDWSEICDQAARAGDRKTLLWLRDTGHLWNVQTCASAAAAGRLDTLRWLLRNGCTWTPSACSYAALDGYFTIVKWAHKRGYAWDRATCTSAARLRGAVRWVRWIEAQPP